MSSTLHLGSTREIVEELAQVKQVNEALTQRLDRLEPLVNGDSNINAAQTYHAMMTSSVSAAWTEVKACAHSAAEFVVENPGTSLILLWIVTDLIQVMKKK